MRHFIDPAHGSCESPGNKHSIFYRILCMQRHVLLLGLMLSLLMVFGPYFIPGLAGMMVGGMLYLSVTLLLGPLVIATFAEIGAPLLRLAKNWRRGSVSSEGSTLSRRSSPVEIPSNSTPDALEQVRTSHLTVYSDRRSSMTNKFLGSSPSSSSDAPNTGSQSEESDLQNANPRRIQQKKTR